MEKQTIKYDKVYNYTCDIIMAQVVVTVRKWGNSIGLTLPADFVAGEKIKPNDKIILSVNKAEPINALFGMIKFKKSAQGLKDELREGWNDA